MTDIDTARPVADWDPEPDRVGGLRDGGVRGPGRVGEYARLREECPVAYSERYGGFYMLTRYRDVSEAARDHQRFRSGAPFVAMPDLGQQIPITLNPPEHTPYRRMLNKFFAKDRIDALEPQVRGFAQDCIVPAVEAGGADLYSALCQPLPARTLARLMNLPDEAWTELVDQIAAFEADGWNVDELAERVFAVFGAHIARTVARRREQPLDPDQDILSGAMAMQIDGEPLPDAMIIGIGVQMIGAGHATTADALGTAVYRLATNPDIQARLRREPALIPDAVEEFLRIETPLADLGRHAAVDVELHGRTIPAGCPVALNYASANRDPEQFDHPEACIIDRTPNRHLAFGHGVHKCVGAPVARLELRVALEELLARTRTIELDAAPTLSAGLLLSGFVKLPVRLVPA